MRNKQNMRDQILYVKTMQMRNRKKNKGQERI